MPKRTSRRSSQKYKRARTDNAEFDQDILKPASTNFKLWLLKEVKKYPILYKSLDSKEDTERCYDAWQEIADSIDDGRDATTLTVSELIEYLRKTWNNLKRSFSRYITGETFGKGATIIHMRALFPEIDNSNNSAPKKKPWQSVSLAVGGNDSCAPDELPSHELQTVAPVNEAPPADAVENNATNNSSEVGSVAAEDILRPTTNHVARVVPSIPQQAATPGNPRSVGARSNERAVSLAIVEHLFDSLRSPAAKTDVCNSLMQLLYNYQPNVISVVIEYAARQPDLFNVDWSGLPIPDDLCHEIWRRDLQKNASKFYKNNSSNRRAKKGN